MDDEDTLDILILNEHFEIIFLLNVRQKNRKRQENMDEAFVTKRSTWQYLLWYIFGTYSQFRRYLRMNTKWYEVFICIVSKILYDYDNFSISCMYMKEKP